MTEKRNIGGFVCSYNPRNQTWVRRKKKGRGFKVCGDKKPKKAKKSKKVY